MFSVEGRQPLLNSVVVVMSLPFDHTQGWFLCCLDGNWDTWIKVFDSFYGGASIPPLSI